MSDEIKVQSKNKKTKLIIAIAAAVISIITIVAIILVNSGGANAKKVKEQLSLGDKYLSELQYEQAIAAYELAIELDPKCEDAYLGLAEVYIATGEFEKAEEILDKAEEALGEETEGIKAVREKLERERGESEKEDNPSDLDVGDTPTKIPISSLEPTVTQNPIEVRTELLYEVNNERTGIVITGVKDRKIETVIIPEIIDGLPVMEIGQHAFNSCTELSQISIPPTVQRIGDSAFLRCTNLFRISLPQDLKTIGAMAFHESGLEGLLELPEGLEYIGSLAFEKTNIGCVSLPDSLKEIDGPVFGNTWEMIASENAPAKELVEKWYTGVVFHTEKFGPMLHEEEEVSFLYELNDDGSNTVAIDKLFHGWSKERVEIPEVIDGYKVSGINAYAFMGADRLEEVVVPSSVEIIGACSFEDCQNLKKIVIPAETRYMIGVGEIFHKSPNVVIVTSEGSEAQRYAIKWGIPVEDFRGNDLSWNTGDFYFHTEGVRSEVFGEYDKEWEGAVVTRLNKTNGNTVTIPDELGGKPVVSIAYQVLGEKSDITEIVLPDTINYIPEQAFAGCETLENIVIPSSVESLGTGAFRDCYKLKTADIRCHISEWHGRELFVGCISLEEVRLPQGIREIPMSMFMNTGVGSFDIPDSVTKIDMQAFAHCYKLTTITIPASVQEIDDTAFIGCTKLTIKTPSGSYAEQYAIESGILVETY